LSHESDGAGRRGVGDPLRGTPLVSVIIAVYNGGRYLAATLDSVFAQTYPDYEVIVVDDGSTDDSRDRAAEFGDRLTLLGREHEGLGAARNAGLARAGGDYIAFLDADDLWDPEYLSRQVTLACRHPESGLVVCDGFEFDEEESVLRTSLLDPEVVGRLDRAADGTFTDGMYADFCARNLVACPAQVIIARHAVDEAGPVALTPNGPQDYDYYVRISRTHPVTFQRASLVRWRFHGDSTSGPAAARNYRWSLWALPTLVREQDQCRPEDRDMLHAATQARARSALADGVYLRVNGGTLERRDLAAIYELAPRTPAVLGFRAALALPAPLDRLALAGARAARRRVRRLTGSEVPAHPSPAPGHAVLSR
jgi:hypothetical protein